MAHVQYPQVVSIRSKASRIFSDDYTASGQLAWSLGERGPSDAKAWWREGYLGQLRLDALFNEVLVIPDTHIIDGAYFLHRGPKFLRDALSRGFETGGTPQLPLEVRTRGDGLESSIANFLVRYGKDGSPQPRLNGFYFKTLSDSSARAQLAAAIRCRTPDDLARVRRSHGGDVVDGVIALLHECFADMDYSDIAAEWLESLANGWRRWLNEAPEVGLRTARWDRRYSLHEATLAEPMALDRLTTELARTVFDDVMRLLAESGWRNDASPIIDEGRAAASGDREAEAEIAAIDWWISRGRYRAIAWQHHCDCIQVDRPTLRPLGIIPDVLRSLEEWPHGERTIELPDDVVSALGHVDNELFAQVVREHRTQLVAFWTTGQAQHIPPVADALDGILPRVGKRLGGLQMTDALNAVAIGASALAGPAIANFVEGGAARDAASAVAGAIATMLVVRSGSQFITAPRRNRLVERATQAYAVD